MVETKFAALAARVLAAARPSVAPAPSSEAREAAIAALAAAMGDRRRAQRLWRATSVLAAAAAIVVVVGFALVRRGSVSGTAVTMTTTRVGPGARLFRAGASSALDEGYAVGPGDRVAAGQGHGGLAVRLSTGSTMKVEPAGELQIVDVGPTQRFALLQGAVRAQVAKLHAGERFLVATPDAEIEVRGTSFRVGLDASGATCDEPSTTRLEVFEGVVAVRRGSTVSLVGAGQRWPTGCRLSEVRDPAPRAPALTGRPPATIPTHAHVARARSAVSPAEDLASTLALQNDLYARALSAERDGDIPGALGLFLDLEHRFPSSALVESSLVGRMRLLRRTDREAARALARTYLARHPNGFARSEAEALVAEPPAR